MESTGEGSLHITYGDSFYRMELRHICAGENGELNLDVPDGDEDETLWAVYLFDETELLALKQEIADQNLVAGLIYLDITTRPWRAWRRCAARFWWLSLTERSTSIFLI